MSSMNSETCSIARGAWPGPPKSPFSPSPTVRIALRSRSFTDMLMFCRCSFLLRPLRERDGAPLEGGRHRVGEGRLLRLAGLAVFLTIQGLADRETLFHDRDAVECLADCL